MLAFEVSINDQRFALAGAEDWVTLHAHLLALRIDGEDSIEIDVGAGLRQREAGKHENLRWGKRLVKLNDTITIRIVETSTTDAPIRRYRSDSTVQETPYTEDEIRDMKRSTYLTLKREFDPDA